MSSGPLTLLAAAFSQKEAPVDVEDDLQAAIGLAKDTPLYPTKDEEKIQSWIKLSSAFAEDSETDFAKKLGDLNWHLKLRTFLTGYSLSLADLAMWFHLDDSPATHWISVIDTNRKISFPFLVRWWNYVSKLPEVVAAKAKIGALKKKLTGEGMVMVDDLVGAVEGQVCTRFPPEPSGYLHIGHAKAAFLNDFYAKKYKGKMILRFDDTNPRKEKEEFEEAIEEDLKHLQVNFSKTSHTSDHFDYILSRAEAMIEAGLAFCDDTEAEKMKELREAGVPSPYRDQPKELHFANWEEMKKGSEKGQKFALRAKIDFAHDNGTMRDPVIYRYVDVPHNRTGDKFKVYPIYNFACPIVDSIEGITHALRSNEYHSSELQYYWFLANIPGLEKRDVRIKDFSRLNFKHTVLSKRKLQWFVDQGLVDSWSDPRFPTVRGMMRRGLTMETLRNFILGIGDSKKSVNMDMTKLWALNKQNIDREIPRYFCIGKDDPVLITLDGPEQPQKVTALKCRTNPAVGEKTIWRANKILIAQSDAGLLTNGEEVTLMDWGNAIIKNIVKEGDKITAIQAVLHLDGDVKKTKWKIQWVPDFSYDEFKPVAVSLVDYDHIITVADLPKDGKLADFVNHNSFSAKDAWAGSNIVSDLKVGDKMQFERVGYFQLDKIQEDGKRIFVEIPAGTTKGFVKEGNK